VPSAEQILKAFDELGTQSSVARFFGVSRRTVERWVRRLDLRPNLRPEIPLNQLLSLSFSDPAVRARVAQWIVDEASITAAYSRRLDTSSLMVIGAMNDNNTMEVIARELGVQVFSGTEPVRNRLPTHVIKVQGPKAYGLLGILSRELTGLKASEAKAALAFLPPSGLVKGKLTTDVFMGEVWERFAKECVEAWNKKRREKKTPDQLKGIMDAWVQNRTARARRGLIQNARLEAGTAVTSAPASP
jgi:hypothetical protein